MKSDMRLSMTHMHGIALTKLYPRVEDWVLDYMERAMECEKNSSAAREIFLEVIADESQY